MRTTAATASIVEVTSGKAPTSTAAIDAKKSAKRCQACAVRPAGTGTSQMPIAIANGTARRGSLAQSITACPLPRPARPA